MLFLENAKNVVGISEKKETKKIRGEERRTDCSTNLHDFWQVLGLSVISTIRTTRAP